MIKLLVSGWGLVFFSHILLNAQTAARPGTPFGTIQGRVADAADNQAIEFAAVALAGPSGEIVTGGLTDKKGQFLLEQVPMGSYLLRIQFIGYKTFQSETITLNAVNPGKKLGPIFLTSSAEKIQEVNVEGEKPVFVHSIDKKVFNVDKSIVGEGGNATDVLENIPSLQVDMEGNVSLRGTGNVTILLDGRPSETNPGQFD